MLNDKMPDGIPDDFDPDKPKDPTPDPDNVSGDVPEDELVGVKKSELLALQAWAKRLYEINEKLVKSNGNLIGITGDLMEELKRLAPIATESLQNNTELIALVTALQAALDQKIKFQYFKYLLCMAWGVMVVWIISMLVRFL